MSGSVVVLLDNKSALSSYNWILIVLLEVQGMTAILHTFYYSPGSLPTQNSFAVDLVLFVTSNYCKRHGLLYTHTQTDLIRHAIVACKIIYERKNKSIIQQDKNEAYQAVTLQLGFMSIVKGSMK